MATGVCVLPPMLDPEPVPKKPTWAVALGKERGAAASLGEAEASAASRILPAGAQGFSKEVFGSKRPQPGNAIPHTARELWPAASPALPSDLPSLAGLLVA